jgi:hypothetical protein
MHGTENLKFLVFQFANYFKNWWELSELFKRKMLYFENMISESYGKELAICCPNVICTSYLRLSKHLTEDTKN